ncbi:MAG TPA: mechanosensitive ion channel family protein [Terracidiphilus sp.]|nr:mechanosensitive ion channel family protein [Terracidiphilus sp.]
MPLCAANLKRSILVLSLLLTTGWSLGAQPATPAKPPAVPLAPVTVNGKALFSVEGVLSFSAQARADAITVRIRDLAKNVAYKSGSISVADSADTSDIVAGDLALMSVTDQDAKQAGESRQALAQDYAHRIDAELTAMRHAYSLKSLILGGVYALLATIVLITILRLLGIVFRKIYVKLNSWRGNLIPSLRIQKFELLPADRIADFAIGVAKLVRLGVILVLCYFYASLVLGFFPWTRGYAQVLLGYVVSPLKLTGQAVITYLPNIFFIAVIALVSFYFTRFVRIIFDEIAKETIAFPNFYPEWAEPTYKIVRVLIIALTLVVIFPYLPGSKSPAFQGVTIFLGVLVSLGSTSAVANIVAGIILTYMRAFKIGDRVKIADTVGDVIEKTLLVTRIRTIKNVEITISNSMVLNSHIVNFSASPQDQRLILHTTVTIGYDAPWRTVHQLLINAALACDGILKDPKPFVFQTVLDDFYVHYEINAYTDQPNAMANIYSDLHVLIQDTFNEGGVEIMSSHYANVRDGNRSTIPDKYLPQGYVTPTFQLGLKDIFSKNEAQTKPDAE